MPIVDLQRRLRELGRIRSGEVVETAAGKRRPSKLEHFRITGHSERIIRQVAELYGGTARQWTPQNGTDRQWEVTVTADRIPILVPPQSISQDYELWSGGGCVRRCDGEQEKKSGGPCLCSPDPTKRQCAVVTRLNVMLPEVEGLGVFRLESHGWYAATELPQVAEFLELAGQYVPAFLALDPRKDVKDGKTRHWLTPVIDVGLTPQRVIEAGRDGSLGLGPAPQRHITPPEERKAIEAPVGPTVVDPESIRAAVDRCETPDELRALWLRISGPEHALRDPRNAEANDLFSARADAIKPPDEKEAADPADEPAGAAPPETGTDPEADKLWAQIVQAAPKDWTTEQLEDDFAGLAGLAAEDASASHMRTYLDTRTENGWPS